MDRRAAGARIPKSLQTSLIKWFEENKRNLPWRRTKDPYKIWISEVMLQQTVSKTVIPYYRAFLKKFPTAKSLSKASKNDLMPLWAGLGYYKRAESLLTAAGEISRRRRFPESYKELLRLPGFGPYTARAVSSLAFQEPVGVLDGNVIRLLSRFHGLSVKWWKAAQRRKLQSLADLWVQGQNPAVINQALMEAGSLVCAPRNPHCRICPLQAKCQAFKAGSQGILPLKRPQKPVELWLYKPQKIKKNSRWALIQNTGALPFLKGRLIFPGQATAIAARPKQWHFSHSITNYQIFVSVQKACGPQTAVQPMTWLAEKQIMEKTPSSLIKKILRFDS